MSVIKNPVWPNGPDLCEKFGIPAFKTEEDASDYHEKNAPGTHTEPTFLCACGYYHYNSTAREPGGNSSGSGRYAKEHS